MLDLPLLAGRRLLALLYADDLALVSTSPEGLQAQLDVLHAYASKWRLTVNIGKTKAVTFRGPNTKVYPLPLVYAGANIEEVDSFRYMGMELHCIKQFGCCRRWRSCRDCCTVRMCFEQPMQPAGN